MESIPPVSSIRVPGTLHMYPSSPYLAPPGLPLDPHATPQRSPQNVTSLSRAPSITIPRRPWSLALPLHFQASGSWTEPEMQMVSLGRLLDRSELSYLVQYEWLFLAQHEEHKPHQIYVTCFIIPLVCSSWVDARSAGAESYESSGCESLA